MLKRTRVMIIDDDSDDRMFFHEALDKLNAAYECVEAKDGVDALKQLRSEKALPDYIFLDLNMPYMDGHLCLKELKKDPLLKNLPVIIYSTSSYQRDIDETSELGASHFLTKVSDIANLPAILLKAMEFATHRISLQ